MPSRITIRRTVQIRATITRRVTRQTTSRTRAVFQPPRPIAIPVRATTTRILSATSGAGPEQIYVAPTTPEREWDVFISYATEDGPTLVRELAAELGSLGIRVWFDESELAIGDSIRRRIDHGLVRSRFGIVVLSHAFFAKKWPQLELDGLAALEVAGRQRILPIWHGLSSAEVLTYSPTLAGKVAARTSDSSIREIAEEIAALIRRS